MAAATARARAVKTGSARFPRVTSSAESPSGSMRVPVSGRDSATSGWVECGDGNAGGVQSRADGAGDLDRSGRVAVDAQGVGMDRDLGSIARDREAVTHDRDRLV